MTSFHTSRLIAFVAAGLVRSVIAQGDGAQAEAGLRAGEDLEVRHYAVDTLVTPYRDVWLDTLGRVFASRPWQGAVPVDEVGGVWNFDDPELSANRLLPRSDRGPCSPGGLFTLIQRVGPGAISTKDGSMAEVRGGTLLAVQSADRLAQLDRVLGAVRGAIAPRYRMTVHIVGRVEDSTERALTVDEAKAIIASAGGVDRSPFGQADVRAGDQVSFNALEDRSLLVDVDVEIAQQAIADDPIVKSIRVGTALTLYSVLDIDGGLAVFGYWTDRRAGPINRRSLAVGSERTLEHCDVGLSTRAFAVRLGRAGGHLVRVGEKRFAIITAVRLEAPVQSGPRVLLPVGLILDPVFTGGDDGIAGIRGHAGSEEQLVALVDAVTQGDAKTPVASIEAGSTLLVRGAEHVDTAKRVLAFEGARFHRRFVVSIEREVLRSGAWTAAGAPIRVPCLGERIGVAVEGTERLVVTDYDVEVAQDAKTTDPIVKACFDGMHTAFRVVPGSANACTLDLALLDRSVGEPRMTTGAVRGAAAIDLVDVRHASITRRLGLTLGEWRMLGRGVDVLVGNTRAPSRLKAKVTELK